MVNANEALSELQCRVDVALRRERDENKAWLYHGLSDDA